MRPNMVLSASLALALWACTSEQTTTEPSSSPNASLATAAAHSVGPTLAVHPSEKLDPDGRTVTVIGKGFPANVELQLAEATGSPLVGQALVNVHTNKHGNFVSRVLVAFDFSVLNPFPLVPTCSEPTFTGDACLLFATMTESPFVSAFTPISFSP